MTKPLPQNITSYDLLKSLAVISMIIDHMGYYFFPEQLIWRSVTNSMPIWLFLVGHSMNREIPRELWIGACILVVGNIIVGMPVFELNILFAIIIVRLTMDSVIKTMFSSNVLILLGIAFMVLAYFPTNFIIEYGTMCYLFAIYGYVVRHKNFTDNGLVIFLLAITLPYLIYTKIIMGFDQTQFYIMIVAAIPVIWLMQYFKPMEFPDLTAKLPELATNAIKMMGRKTLEIYVIHLLLFKIIALFVMSDRYQFLDFRLF